MIKVTTTIVAILWHILLGIGRCMKNVLLIGLSIVITIMIAIWRQFSRGYFSTWNTVYARIGSPICEICQQPKSKGRMVKHNDHCNQWLHEDCWATRAVAEMIQLNDNKSAAAAFKLSHKGILPINIRVLMKLLREHRDPYKHDLFRSIARLKQAGKTMSWIDAVDQVLEWTVESDNQTLEWIDILKQILKER